MKNVVDKWMSALGGLAGHPVWHRRHAVNSRLTAGRMLALVPEGANRLALQAVSEDAGLAFAFSETLSGAASLSQSIAPAVIVLDRELSPHHWRAIARLFAGIAPRPYIILLSPSADPNLWDELQRAGGADIVRTPIDPERLRESLERGWNFWRAQQKVRSPVQTV